MHKIASIKLPGIPITAGYRNLSVSSAAYDKYKCRALIIGGGTGGCSIGAKLSSNFKQDECIILEPASYHYYQPMFTMIGGGMKSLSQSRKSMATVLPKKAKWIQDAAAKFNTNSNEVITKQGHVIFYEFLVIAVGLQLNYGKVNKTLNPLEEALSVPNGNVTSIYSPKYVDRHLKALQQFQSGNIIFTFPASPVKCPPGAPQKICYITEHYLRRTNKRNSAKIYYNSSLPTIFGCKYFADALWEVVKQREIEVNLKTNLVEVHGDKNTAIFANVENPNERQSVEYSILHAVPPQSVPQVLLEEKELTNEAGFVDVDKLTLQHKKFSNVFALETVLQRPIPRRWQLLVSISDSESLLPGISEFRKKTYARFINCDVVCLFLAGQVGVLHRNISKYLEGQSLNANYDGYASCPLVTGYDSCIMAEFDYDLRPKETFPFRQDCERYSMFLMKRDVMPLLYWHLMLNGYWNGPEPVRKIFSIFKFN